MEILSDDKTRILEKLHFLIIVKVLNSKFFYHITETFHLYAKSFILRILLRRFLQTVAEPLHLLTVNPKLIFRGVLKKALMVPEDKTYQTQRFLKFFPSPLALTQQIHFCLHFQ